ncbi:MAG: diguanylate cyclase [Actinomycetota bacterium]
MSVQARLFLAFFAIVLVPMVLIGITGSQLVVTQIEGSSFQLVGAAMVLLAVLGAGLLGVLVARTATRSLRDLAAGAQAVAEGRYGEQMAAEATDEVGQLARLVNQLSTTLSTQGADIAQYRELLDRAYLRFGEALRSTHDLDKILELVLESGMETAGAKRGAVMMIGDDNVLRVRVGRNLPAGDFELPVGEGIAGRVAATGEPVWVPEVHDLPSADPREPEAASVVAAPLTTQSGVMGVAVLYDKARGSFSRADLSTLVSRADQGGVAIENAMLHAEAQRLAITDGLTGIWNHRFFQLQLEQELERSVRFQRPFSLIILDIDDFKRFNDTYGHQVGDQILIELARRLQGEIRDVDILARYGGEEFVVLLPETEAPGAHATAERLRRVVAERPFTSSLVDSPLTVTLSLGVSGFPEAGQEKAQIFRAADLALLKAKSLGKNRVVRHLPTAEEKSEMPQTPPDGRRAADRDGPATALDEDALGPVGEGPAASM